MKKFTHLLYNKLTLGLALSALGSLAFAVLFRLYLDHLFNITPVKGGLTVVDLSYFLSIVTIKVFLATLLELILGEKFYTPLGVYINDPNSIISKMDKSKVPGAEKGSGSSTSNNTPDNKAKVEPDHYDKLESLQKEMSSNLHTQYDMVKKLRELKSSRGLKYYNNKGALELDLPISITEEEAMKLSKQIGIIDRIYNTKRSEYKSLAEQNDSLRGSYLNLSKLVKNNYKELFEK